MKQKVKKLLPYFVCLVLVCTLLFSSVLPASAYTDYTLRLVGMGVPTDLGFTYTNLGIASAYDDCSLIVNPRSSGSFDFVLYKEFSSSFTFKKDYVYEVSVDLYYFTVNGSVFPCDVSLGNLSSVWAIVESSSNWTTLTFRFSRRVDYSTDTLWFTFHGLSGNNLNVRCLLRGFSIREYSPAEIAGGEIVSALESSTSDILSSISNSSNSIMSSVASNISKVVTGLQQQGVTISNAISQSSDDILNGTGLPEAGDFDNKGDLSDGVDGLTGAEDQINGQIGTTEDINDAVDFGDIGTDYNNTFQFINSMFSRAVDTVGFNSVLVFSLAFALAMFIMGRKLS